MRANKLKEIWEQGGAVINGWLSIPHSFAAETMAHQGWDSLTIDMQHGVVGYDAAINLLIAVSTTDVVPMVRVPWRDQGIMMKMLDAGAYGLICPMVNNTTDAEEFVSATHYPPRGERSFGPIRGLIYGGSDYSDHANDTVVRFAMIETKGGLDNLDDIVRIDGLDAVYIGPSDLSLALGEKPMLDQRNPHVVEAIDHILATTKKHGKIAGIHNAGAAYAAEMVEKGFQFVTIGSDSRLMALAATTAVRDARDAMGDKGTLGRDSIAKGGVGGY
ncbi:MAG: aldolase/citrate lyase family protein [Pseudomonadota bacterium]